MFKKLMILVVGLSLVAFAAEDPVAAIKKKDGELQALLKKSNHTAKEKEREAKEKEKAKKKTASSGRKKQTAFEKTVNTAANTIGRELGKKFVRGLFDILKK